jgi:predicted peptidase
MSPFHIFRAAWLRNLVRRAGWQCRASCCRLAYSSETPGMGAKFKYGSAMLRFQCFGVIFFCLFLLSAAARTAETGFLNRTVKIGTETYRFQVYVPKDWSKKQKWPVILFLHGAGERGDDGLIQTEVGIGTAIRRYSERFPAVVVFPQCRRNVWWTEPAMEEQALKTLDQSIKEFNGDAERTYLTGISMGGYGTWSIASKHPGRFAALAPVCGGIRIPARAQVPEALKNQPAGADPYAETAKKIGQTPVWIFHGGDDSVVPPGESRKMTEALKAVNGDVRYSEYDKVNHNSWDKAYAEKELMTWMLGKRRTKSGR